MQKQAALLADFHEPISKHLAALNETVSKQNVMAAVCAGEEGRQGRREKTPGEDTWLSIFLFARGCWR